MKIYEIGEYTQKRICTGSDHFYLFFDKSENAITNGVIKCRVYAEDNELLSQHLNDYNSRGNVQNLTVTEIGKDGKTILQGDFDFCL